MANEQDKSEQARKSVKIEDLPQSTDASAAEQVKGGMISRGGGPIATDPEDDEVIGE